MISALFKGIGKLIGGIFKLIWWIMKIIFMIIILICDHILGIFAGAFMGAGKGLSGLFGMGMRSFALGLASKTTKLK